jgi:hypothetical protein
VDGQLQAYLGGKLRAVYRPVVEEALPQRFRDLLDALERRDLESRSRLIIAVSRLLGHAVAATVGPSSSEAGERPRWAERT